MDVAARDALLLPPDAPLSGMARLDVDAPTALALAQGSGRRRRRSKRQGTFRCYGPAGRFVGLVEATRRRAALRCGSPARTRASRKRA